MDERDLLRQFVDEAEDLVESLHSDLLILSRDPVGGLRPDVLNRVFRSAHSLKGVAGMAGVPSVQRAAHKFEDLLDDVRMGRVRPGPTTLDGCGRVADELGRMIAAVADGAEATAIERDADAVESLVAELRSGAAGAPEAATDAVIDLDEKIRQTFTEYEEHRLQENLNARRPVYELRVAFDLMSFDVGFRGLLEKLGAAGEVIGTLPAAGGDDPSRIGFRIIAATNEPQESIDSLIGTLGGTATLISHYPEPIVEPPPEFPADGAGASTAVSVRVDMGAVDDLVYLSRGLALDVAGLAASAEELAVQVGMPSRELFDLKQRARSIERGFSDLEERLVEMRLVPIGQVYGRARRLVGRLAAELGREVDFVTSGEDVRLDKAIVDRISEPIAHLLRNAVDHGIESPDVRRAAEKSATGRIELIAEPRGNRVALIVRDDGAGIDVGAVRRAANAQGLAADESIEAIFAPGVSTAGAVTEVSGRGVGLDAVAAVVAALGGTIAVETERGKGTTFVILLPTTLVMLSVFLVEAAGGLYAIDVNQIGELASLDATYVERAVQATPADCGHVVEWRGESVRLYRLAELVGSDAPSKSSSGVVQCVTVRIWDRDVALSVDRLVGEREAIVKTVGRYMPVLKGVNGAIDIEGGRIALLLDIPGLIAEHRRLWSAAGAGGS